MRCDEVTELMQRNLDDDLSADELTVLENHLRSCSECQTLYDDLKALSSELENLPDVEPPISLVDMILPELEREDSHKPKVASLSNKKNIAWKRWALLGGSAAAILFLYVTTQESFERPDSQSQAQLQTAQRADRTETQEKPSQETALEEKETIQAFSPPVESASVPDNGRAAESTGSAEKTSEKQTDSTRQTLVKQPESEKKESSPPSEIKKSQKQPALPEESMAMKVPEVPEPKARGNSEDPKQEVSREDAEDPGTVAIAPEPANPSEPLYSMSAPESAPSETSDSMIAEEPRMFMAKEPASSPEQQDDRPQGVVMMPSPSGQWMARVEGNTVVVYDRQAMPKLRSHAWPSTYRASSLQWLDDYTLIYVLQEPEGDGGGSEKWRIDLRIGQERKM